MGFLCSVSDFIKDVLLQDYVTIDSMIFRLHYRFTSTILFLCCILSAINSFSDHAIECFGIDLSQDYLNVRCWSKPSYILTRYRDTSVKQINNKDAYYYHYYQWVPFILFIQGILFYIPHFIWKNLEHGKVRMLSDGLGSNMMTSQNDRSDRQSHLVKYLVDTFHLHNAYAISYFLCEVLNFINVVCNIHLVDWFVGGTFSELGTDVFEILRLEQDQRVDPMITVFPHNIKCDVQSYGSSGSIIIHSNVCSMTINHLYEKIFIFLWLWFIFLAVVSGLSMLYTWIIMLVPFIHVTILKWLYAIVVPSDAFTAFSLTKIGDYFLLHLLGLNINSVAFGEVLHGLNQNLKGYSPSKAPCPTSVHEMQSSCPYQDTKQ